MTSQEQLEKWVQTEVWIHNDTDGRMLPGFFRLLRA